MMHDMIRNSGRWTVWTFVAATLGLLLAIASPASAQTINWIGSYFALDMSADGSVVVGNTADGKYETFRWTEATGVVRLGMSTADVGVGGAGTPDVSDDGNHVSATIGLYPDSLATQGLWTKGTGWEWSIPPIPPTGGVMDRSLASCWGLSGDGTTLTGFYWRPGATDGSAHANTWSTVDGFEALPTPIRSCRGNDLNYDGSVVVGWSENDFGTWCPTVWEDGGVTQLQDLDWSVQAEGVSGDGNTIWGTAVDTVSGHRAAAIWLRDGPDWDLQILGVLPGTFLGYGQAIPHDMTEDGHTMVGYNAFDWGTGTGFVWTLQQGMMSAADFMAAEGFVFPENFLISDLTGISANGKVICGLGYDSTIFPQQWQSFVATRGAVAAVPGALANGGLSIDSNHPNPFNPATTISLTLDRDQNVRLEIFDIRGRSVRVVHDGHLTAGNRELEWDGRDGAGRPAASGVYFARARGEKGATASHRMVLVK